MVVSTSVVLRFPAVTLRAIARKRPWIISKRLYSDALKLSTKEPLCIKRRKSFLRWPSVDKARSYKRGTLKYLIKDAGLTSEEFVAVV
jgi:hypothetical protein